MESPLLCVWKWCVVLHDSVITFWMTHLQINACHCLRVIVCHNVLSLNSHNGQNVLNIHVYASEWRVISQQVKSWFGMENIALCYYRQHQCHSRTTTVVCWCIFAISVSNSLGPDQTAPYGAVWSGFKLFACKLKLISCRSESLQQTDSIDDIFKWVFVWQERFLHNQAQSG